VEKLDESKTLVDGDEAEDLKESKSESETRTQNLEKNFSLYFS
jgi:hypothetical protein